MSTTRNLLNGMNAPQPTLDRVKPTKSLLITSMPCEYAAAAIRNKAVTSMEAGDVSGVWKRHRNSLNGENDACSKIVWLTLFMIFELVLFYNIEDTSQSLEPTCPANDLNVASLSSNELGSGSSSIPPLFALFSCILGFLLPTLSNAIRYRETREGCEAWLLQELEGHSSFNARMPSFSSRRHSLANPSVRMT